MATILHQDSLTVRQRLGLALLLIVAISALCIALYRSFSHERVVATQQEMAVIRELQTIAPVRSQTTDTIVEVVSDSVVHTETNSNKKTRHAAKQNLHSQHSTTPSRDISRELVSPQ